HRPVAEVVAGVEGAPVDGGGDAVAVGVVAVGVGRGDDVVDRLDHRDELAAGVVGEGPLDGDVLGGGQLGADAATPVPVAPVDARDHVTVVGERAAGELAEAVVV